MTCVARLLKMVKKPDVNFTPGTPGNVNDKLWVDWNQNAALIDKTQAFFQWQNLDVSAGYNGFTPDRIKITPSVGSVFGLYGAASASGATHLGNISVMDYVDQEVTWTVRCYNSSTLQEGPVQDTFTSYFEEKNFLRFGPNLGMGMTPTFGLTTGPWSNTANLNDGDADSATYNAGALTNNTVNMSVTYDFGRPIQVDGWGVTGHSTLPIEVASWVEYSFDNVNWVTADMGANIADNNFRPLAPSRKPSGGAQYWRFRANGNRGANDSQGLNKFELRQFAPDNEVLGDDVSSLGTAISGGATGGGPAANAFDYNMATYFEASQAQGTMVSGGAYIGLDFGSNSANWQAIRSVYVRQQEGIGSAQYSMNWTLEYSDNGSAWTQLGGVITHPAVAGQSRTKETRLVTVGSVWPETAKHRYWRIRPNGTESTIGWRVTQVQMFNRNFAEFMVPKA